MVSSPVREPPVRARRSWISSVRESLRDSVVSEMDSERES